MTISVESLTILYEEYEYSEKLGAGKFGSVYRVVHKETGDTRDISENVSDDNCSGKIFAAKHVTCRRASEKRRIMEEVDILGSIHHPQIMRLYRVFADLESCLSDDIVLILEYLSG